MKKVDIFVSQKMSILADLREQVNQLKVENKQLSRQLHLDRYVSKHRAQRTINDLRSENLRLQRETAAIRDRITARTTQAQVHEDVTLLKRQETNDLRLQSQSLIDKIKEIAGQIEMTKKKNEQAKQDLNAKNIEIENFKLQIKGAKETRDDEIALKKEISEAVLKTKSDIRKLQDRCGMQVAEAKRLDDANDKMNKELERTEAEIDKLKEKVRQSEKRYSKTEDEIRKLKEELRHVTVKRTADSAKCSALLSDLHDESKDSQAAQTEPVTSQDAMSFEDEGDDVARGTMVRVLGVGGNAKRKFGKDLEVRATSYSRHVNLNVKLNK